MKRTFAFFMICVFSTIGLSWGAVNVKKAAPVAMQKESVMDSTTSLLPTVIGLVQNVKNLKTQQQQVTAECEPSSDEISIVNDLVREWAKIGDTSKDALQAKLKVCAGTNYKDYMFYESEGYKDTCFDVFSSSGYIWDGFPQASIAKENCSNLNSINCKVYSNIYDVFAMIPFSDPDDYTEQELKKIAKVKEKYAKCSTQKVNEEKRKLSGDFVTNTLSGVGKTTGTVGLDGVLQTVQSMGGSGSLGTLLPSLGTAATSILDK